MKRLFQKRRLLGVTSAMLALVVTSTVLLRPRVARAFTLVNNTIYFDPVAVPAGHTLHVHLVNQFGAGAMMFRPVLKPTTPAAGSSVLGTFVSLNPGEGSDQSFAFSGFAPPAGATRVPVVCSILVTGSATSALPADWSGRVASSVEVVDDATGVPVALLGGRHIVRSPVVGALTPCLFCN
jgi:hypothetical protein